MNNRSKEHRTMIDEYMNYLCEDLTTKQTALVFQVAVSLGMSGVNLKDPDTIVAFKTCMKFIAFLQELDGNS